MKFRLFVPVIVLVLLVVAGLVAFAWTSTPELIEISPQAGSENVSAGSSIRLTFSRPMDQDSVSTRLKIEPAVTGTTHWEGNSLVFTPSQPWPDGAEIQLYLDNGARAATWLAFPIAGNRWSFTVGGENLAYLWPSSGPANIYALDSLTGDIYQYTQGMSVLDYNASQDGQRFYFSAANSQGGADLYLIDRMGFYVPTGSSNHPQKLLACGLAQCRNPAVAPDGQTLAYEYLIPDPQGSLAPAQIWTLRLVDLVANRLGPADHETVQPIWSATGLLAFYDRTSSAYVVYDPHTQQQFQLPNQTGQPGDWSPDGGTFLAPEISYQQSGTSYETGSSHLYRYDIKTRTGTDISGDSTVEDVEAIFSPNGASIAFTRKYLDPDRWSLGRQVWVMGGDGLNPHPITNEPDYNHYDLAWSRDGKRLAYVRFNQAKISDPPELWLVNQDGSQPVQLVIGGYSPIWIP
jgi:Tol biopolymer transport system component